MNECEEKCIDALTEYFEKNIKNLENPDPEIGYDWPITKVKGFPFDNDYQANVALKEHFYRQWCRSDTNKLDIAKQVVKDWGAIKNIREETLQRHINEIEKKSPNTPLEGVSSYSKIFSITDLDKYAIYDSRVAACLNAVQYNKNVRGLAFNYPPGRNKIIGRIVNGKGEGFVHDERFKIQSLVNIGLEKIDDDKTYNTYLRVLGSCLTKLNKLQGFKKYRLYDLEMTLFANAEKECEKTMNSIKK